MSDNNDIAEDAVTQIKQQGAASYQVKDGQVFIFTTKTLEALLAAAIESGTGKAMVFVKGRPAA
jgi:tRNA A37 threonylcarbamoyladenosine synthetase subunit TsaC/SUA5/YrdC